MNKLIGRNDPCVCGSGKKYKKCCLEKNSFDDDLIRAETIDLKNRAKEILGNNVRMVNPEDFGNSKMSEVILDYASELINASATIEQQKSAINVSIIMRNISFLDKDDHESAIKKVAKDLSVKDDDSDFFEIASFLLNKKLTQEPFCSTDRIVLDYKIIDTSRGWHLTVVSSISEKNTDNSVYLKNEYIDAQEKQYCLDDFRDDHTWLVSRMDCQTKEKPVDIYYVLDLPSNRITHHIMVEDIISQIQADELIEGSKKITEIPKSIILANNDPAEEYVRNLAVKLNIEFKTLPDECLCELTDPIKISFGEKFFSTSAMSCVHEDDYDDWSNAQHYRRMIPDNYDLCPCASGKKYKFCCRPIFQEILEAIVAAQDGNEKKALKWISKAKDIVGETSEVLCREAIVYNILGDYEKGEKLINRCLSINPKHPRAHYIRAIEFSEKKDYSNAIKSYKDAIANYPPSDHFHLNETYNNLGVAFHAIGDVSSAKEAWEKALLYSPHDSMARQNLEEFT